MKYFVDSLCEMFKGHRIPTHNRFDIAKPLLQGFSYRTLPQSFSITSFDYCTLNF